MPVLTSRRPIYTRRRAERAIGAAAAAALAAVILQAPAASAAVARTHLASRPVPGPLGDAFYAPPSPLPSGPHGSLIWYQPEVLGSGVSSGSRAWVVLYKSSSAAQDLGAGPGAADAVTGTVIVPSAPWAGPGQRPVITFDVGSQGMGSTCAASKELTAGTEFDAVGMQAALAAGYAVVATDYEGYTTAATHTYAVGQSEGHATLDIVRAATQIPGSGLTSSNPVGIWGYSEGGQAAAWAAQEQPAYSPGMHVLGVAAGGVPADLKVTAAALNGQVGSAFLLDAVVGFHTAYPALPFASLINAAGRQAIAAVTAPDECMFSELTGFAFTNISSYTNGGVTLPQLLAIPQWSAALDANALGSTGFSAPLFAYHAFFDEIVPTTTEDALVASYCRLHMTVQAQTYYIADHLTTDYEAVPDVIKFFQARVQGAAATSTC